ncbi:DUF58 domain-containing protein [Marinobacter sp. X15-166B]|uniref:DUF58 domain-containing protein n=1 Tax=Marinobacter sp. X15-166B TaxID=1897620 RepID=UPI00085CB5BB|nr:DUF58 domain-containing protein [Marinobacter sp. X15-166B]OEY67105.1 hypothetical protein BG841_12000 [Marinobacter sp. X15-166B]
MPALIATDQSTRIGLTRLISLQADARALRLPPASSVRRQAGARRSPHRGRGMVFSEVRPYQPGDDIRSIDWRVTARRQAPHTKLFEEEKERPVLLICDLGPSMFFSSTGAYKQVRAAQLTGILAWLTLWSGDQVGGIVFNQDQIVTQRPARRKKSVLELLGTLAALQQDGTDTGRSRSALALDTALQEARRVSHTGSRVFVISDFMRVTDDTPSLLGALSQHNDVTAVRIVDPLERHLPDKGRFAVASPEGPVWFDGANPEFQRAFQHRVRTHEARLTRCFSATATHHHTVFTDEDPAPALQQLLGPRGTIG